MKTNRSLISLSRAQYELIMRNCHIKEAGVWHRGGRRCQSGKRESNTSLNVGGICLRIQVGLMNFALSFNWFDLSHYLSENTFHVHLTSLKSGIPAS